MRKLLARPRAVAGLALETIDDDTRLFELEGCDLHLKLVEPQGRHRVETQQFIAEAYYRIFQARLKAFYPSLIALHGEGPQLLGAAGARYADGQELFAEQYLSRSAERAIQERTGIRANRRELVEVGSFSVRRPALTYPFISMIGCWLESYGVEWLVFVLTHTLRRLFQRAGAELLDLGPAAADRLSPSHNDWARYYEHDPRVMAVRLRGGLASFHACHPALDPAGRCLEGGSAFECRA